MNKSNARKRFARHIPVVAALLACIPASLAAQGPPDTPQRLRIGLDAPAAALLPINLRPNTATTVQVRLQNPTPDDFRNFTVKLVQCAGDQVRIIAQGEIAKLLPREEVRLAFLPPVARAAKPIGKDGGPPVVKAGPELVELAGPPFHLQVWVEPKLKGDFPPIKQDVEIAIREPRDYVAARASYDAGAGRVAVRLSLDGRERLIGPPVCPVEMVLGPELIPTKKGAFKQILTAPAGVAELNAAGVAFMRPAVRAGYVSLTVDGYPRAFVYPLSLRGPGELSAADFRKRIGVRVAVPAYNRPAAKFPVRLELDGPLQGDYRVEVALDRTGARELFNQVVKLPSLRQQKVRIGIAPTGDLRCQTEVRDWQLEFDTTGVYGRMWLRVAVLHRGRLASDYEPIELAIPTYAGPALAPLEVDAESRRAFVRVIQDDSRPEGIVFVDVPAEWPANKPLPVKIKVAERGIDQAPIATAVLLRGKVPPDGKLNPDALLGPVPFDVKAGAFRTTLPPQNKVGPLELSVLLTTHAGVSASETVVVALKEPAKAIARITGTVTYGPNPIPNAAVALIDEKGMAKANTKSSPTGTFAFEKVPPGNYVISAAQSFPALVGQAKVTVPEGVELVDKVAIRLLSK